MLPLAHALPVVPQAHLVLGLVLQEVRREVHGVALPTRIDLGDARVVLLLLLGVPLLGLLLARVELSDAILAVLVEALEHRQGGHEVRRALRLQVELEASEGVLVVQALVAVGLVSRGVGRGVGRAVGRGGVQNLDQLGLHRRPLLGPEEAVLGLRLLGRGPLGAPDGDHAQGALHGDRRSAEQDSAMALEEARGAYEEGEQPGHCRQLHFASLPEDELQA
mmetsp:Transcript_70838/g.152601  ORF Transcript_70838/g.152601 Transcript_70838/m.152601 type:complete len:221 (-) Transcript_70838:9-671(-)